MGVMLGFFVGYVMGTRAGQEGFEELVATARQIAGSEQLKELVSGGMSLLGEAAKAGTKAVGSGNGASVRRIA
jgi:hypothetical protein